MVLVVDLDATVSGRFSAKLLGMTERRRRACGRPGRSTTVLLAAYLGAHSRTTAEPPESLVNRPTW